MISHSPTWPFQKEVWLQSMFWFFRLDTMLPPQTPLLWVIMKNCRWYRMYVESALNSVGCRYTSSTLMEIKRFSANLSKISQAFCCHYSKSEKVANKNIIFASSLKEGFTVAILHSVWKHDPVLQHWIEGSSQREFVCPVITCYCCMTGEVRRPWNQ